MRQSEEIAERFPDLHPPFVAQAAIAEANRCLNCFDAPCMAACPTHIDVPRFIGKIARDNLRGSALTILDANVLGAQLLARLSGRGALRRRMRAASL